MLSSTQPSRFLDLPALAALERLRFTTRHRIEGAYSGRHRSRQQGGSGEFVDYREYVDGEDLRRLDWKVLARTGRAYTRLYQDETNLSCLPVLDVSGSMSFGGSGPGDGLISKLEYAQYLVSALSHLIVHQQDQIALATIADGLKAYIPPGSTEQHAARIREGVENIQTSPASDIGAGLNRLFQQVNRRGVMLLISDFLFDDMEAAFAAIRLFRHRRWEMVMLHLVHPQEERLPAGVAFRFMGMENDGRVDCSPAEIRQLYEERFEAHAAMVRTMALAAGCDYRRISTGIPYLQTLSSFLVERTG